MTQEELPKSEASTMVKLPKENLTERKRCPDDEYDPHQETSRNQKKSKQLENRNIVPNIVRLVLSFVQKPGKSSKLVEGLLQKDGC